MREELTHEYVHARIQFGDFDEEEEAMSHPELVRHLYRQAEAMTDDQLVRACNSYAFAE